MVDQNAYRSLPGIDTVLKEPSIVMLMDRWGKALVTFAAREEIADLRRSLHNGARAAPSLEKVAECVARRVGQLTEPALKPVVNATGIVLHTNLGRAPLGEETGKSVLEIARGYCNLEFDIAAGRRGHRVDHVREVLRYLTGAEDVVVVNNNAAAIILVLNTLAAGREVIISRGELIEIGGAFRIPDIMAAGGARMVEVGTTNRTRLTDYTRAISEQTALLFKAHKSNYTISGFTEEVTVRELAEAARSRGIPFVYDIGSGLLRKPEGLGLEKEPDVRGALEEGADLVMFSCDKLLGGPQAGIVAGKAELILRLAGAPLMRALRVGKLTLAALSAACRNYLTDAALIERNPTFRMLSQRPAQLQVRASALAEALTSRGIACRTEESRAQCGGGTLPDLSIPSYCVTLIAPGGTAKERERFAEAVHEGMLAFSPAVLAVLREGRVVLDVFTLSDSETTTAAEAVAAAYRREGERP